MNSKENSDRFYVFWYNYNYNLIRIGILKLLANAEYIEFMEIDTKFNKE